MKELLGLTPRPRIVTACAGAGFALSKMLWETPGASEYLVGCYYPYDCGETDEFLGFEPGQYVSEETAIHLAIEAYMRATLRSLPGDNPTGLGLTASVASLKPHRGAHRLHYAAMSDLAWQVGYVELERDSGLAARLLDDDTCSGIAAEALLDLVKYQEVNPADKFRTAFLSRPFFATGPGDRRRAEPHDGALFPGNFDPIHFGHEAIAEAVSRRLQMPVILCITGNPPHKPALTVQQMARRAATLRAKGHPILFSDDDPLYIDKARRFPGRTLIIGADALLRMLDPVWGPAVEPMLSEFKRLGTRFRVVPRIIDGKLVSLADIDVRRFGHIFYEVEIDGPLDVSSTQLRGAQ